MAPERGEDTPATCAPNCVDAFAEPGAYAAGFRVEQAGDLVLKVWYPTQTEPSAIEYAVTIKFPMWPRGPEVILGEAAIDAPPAEGSFPLVVLSHGFSLNPEWYRTIAEHLATHGYVVLAPEHAESDWFTDVVSASLSRPADVSATIDAAASGALAAVTNTDKVAVLGHSYGGYTALASAGARPDLGNLEAACASVEDEFTAAFFCVPFLAGADVLAAGFGGDVDASGPWPSMGDPRVDAVVALAGDAYLFGPEGLASVTVPVLALGGTQDTGTPWDWGTGLTDAAVGSTQRVTVAMDGGEHFLPIVDCADLPWSGALPSEQVAYICQDPAWEKQASLDVVHHMTTAFLEATLRGDAVAAEALDPVVYEDTPMLTVTASGF